METCLFLISITPWRRFGEWKCSPTHSLTRHFMEVCGQLHTPAALPHWVRALSTYWIRCWVGLRIGLDAMAIRKLSHYCPSLELNSSRLCRRLISILACHKNNHCFVYLEVIFLQCKFNRRHRYGTVLKRKFGLCFIVFFIIHYTNSSSCTKYVCSMFYVTVYTNLLWIKTAQSI
jgi:hypothetical protein